MGAVVLIAAAFVRPPAASEIYRVTPVHVLPSGSAGPPDAVERRAVHEPVGVERAPRPVNPAARMTPQAPTHGAGAAGT